MIDVILAVKSIQKNNPMGRYLGFACAGAAVVDISYLKVKNITLAYSLQKKELEKIHLQKLRFYITVTNPFVATQYRGFDPEWAHASLKNDAPSTINAQIGMSLKF